MTTLIPRFQMDGRTLAHRRRHWVPSVPFGIIFATCLAAMAGVPVAVAGECANPRALSVSRTVTIDAAGGPRYGHQQYKDNDFLKQKEIVLTFDDGPLRRNTKSVLEALAAHCTKATFFMVGRQAVADPDMVKEIAKRGHSLANHTWSHQNLGARNTDRAIAEIELGISAVKAAAGAPVLPFFRFPYLSDPKRMIAYLKARDVGMFSIDVDSYDYRTRSGDEVHRKIISQLESRGQRGILLFHDIQGSTARGLRPLLDDLAARGYKVVHLTSKTPVRSLPEYDEEAQRLLAKRNYMANSKPLATRSFTWQMPAPGADDDIVDRVRQKAAQRQAQVAKPPQPSPIAAPPTVVPPAPAPSLPKDEVPDWRRAIFER